MEIKTLSLAYWAGTKEYVLTTPDGATDVMVGDEDVRTALTAYLTPDEREPYIRYAQAMSPIAVDLALNIQVL
ncbi:hypothetical protein ABZ801_01145 [Actinomadura sp. NPDC047616]|uniref:hypothetical protein n=1 Tax=Actinomadura sp. NPDC047616 TaxID=3155914 RepID=UPI0033D469D2